EHAYRLARLHEQRLILVQCLEGSYDAVKIIPGPCSPSDTAIDHQLVRIFGYIRIKIVHQHPQRRFSSPEPGVQPVAARSANLTDVVARIGHGGHPLEEGDWVVAHANAVSRIFLSVDWIGAA